MPDFTAHSLRFTASEATHVATLNQIITGYLSTRADVPDRLNTLLQADAQMPMAWVLQGYLLKQGAHPALAPRLDEVLTGLAACRELTAREQAHQQALRAWVDGKDSSCASILEEILIEHPHDMLALRILHYIYFYQGSGATMQRSTGAALAQWDTQHPQYGYLLGMHAFGLEEDDQYAAAEDHALRALEHNQDDLWAVHAYAHCCYMQGNHERGLDWLNSHQGLLAEVNNFGNHLIWHATLHHLALGQLDAAMSIYDEQLADTVNDDFYLDLCNNAALLWRLESAGVDVGDRWLNQAENAVLHANDRELPFAGLHYLLAIQRGAPQKLELAKENFRIWGQGEDDAAALCRLVGTELSEHIANASLARFNAAELAPLGGSKAQRELFADFCV